MCIIEKKGTELFPLSPMLLLLILYRKFNVLTDGTKEPDMYLQFVYFDVETTGLGDYLLLSL